MEQLSLFEEMETIRLSKIYEILSRHLTPEYILGYKEKLELWKDNHCLQLNVYLRKKDKETNEKIIKKGCYFTKLSNGNYKISMFSSELLGGNVDYDGGIRADFLGGGRYGITDTTQFLKWFVNQNEIIDDLGEI